MKRFAVLHMRTIFWAVGEARCHSGMSLVSIGRYLESCNACRLITTRHCASLIRKCGSVASRHLRRERPFCHAFCHSNDLNFSELELISWTSCGWNSTGASKPQVEDERSEPAVHCIAQVFRPSQPGIIEAAQFPCPPTSGARKMPTVVVLVLPSIVLLSVWSKPVFRNWVKFQYQTAKPKKMIKNWEGDHQQLCIIFMSLIRTVTMLTRSASLVLVAAKVARIVA